MSKYILITILFFFLFVLKSHSNESLLWNSTQNTVAFCKTDKNINCYVVTQDNVVDVSSIVKKNIAKLGNTEAGEYEKIEVFPSKWVKTDGFVSIVVFTTIAWLNGQRHKIDGTVVVKNGKYIQQ